MAPPLEVEEPLVCLQRGPPGLLQHPFGVGLVPRGLSLGVSGIAAGW